MGTTETAAEKRIRLQKEAEDKAAREEREAEERAVFDEHGLDYDDEDTRAAVAVRRVARKLDALEQAKQNGGSKEKNKRKGGLFS
jgi:hypothetical protein